jgi:hypothetical protein
MWIVRAGKDKLKGMRQTRPYAVVLRNPVLVKLFETVVMLIILTYKDNI